ncbi:E3 ubiquitin-protein ligase RNF14 isoform X1 [Hydra vulgaris]|uniref:RBR-type E3 ubiquitin transferase n=1 Tax=Hydra vulgaris TaxID=6087 RepID=T2M4D7_HYDVU|nr:E3 ubiquitin-protein ligase RNF14 [Hydra vulgaris]
MNEDNYERIKNELDIIESIYSESFVRSSEGFGGQLSAHVELPSSLKLLYSASNTIGSSDESFVVLDIDYLPAIALNFKLPEGYPTLSPPVYTLSCKWLTKIQLSRLCEALDKCWTSEDGQEVLYTWMQVLTNDVWKTINVSNELILSVSNSAHTSNLDCRVFQETDNLNNLVTYLIDYNSKEAQQKFNNAFFECALCFLEKPGSKCVSFSKCKHIYCRECIEQYFSIKIRDGSVRGLICPQEKCESQADPNFVRTLVSPELYEKYDSLLLQSTLDCMDEIAYCPRKTCNAVVLKELNMGQCPVCRFVFCVLCKRTYHGVNKCPVNSGELKKLREAYLNGTAEEKEYLEKRYGKKQLKQAVEEHFSETWLENNSKKCPNCSTYIEKIDGCNKMKCYKCETNFCWLCGKGLPAANPYEHFNSLKTGCFNRLFEGIDVDNLSDDSDDNLE